MLYVPYVIHRRRGLLNVPSVYIRIARNATQHHSAHLASFFVRSAIRQRIMRLHPARHVVRLCVVRNVCLPGRCAVFSVHNRGLTVVRNHRKMDPYVVRNANHLGHLHNYV